MPKSNPKDRPSSDGALHIYHASAIYPRAGPWLIPGDTGQGEKRVIFSSPRAILGDVLWSGWQKQMMTVPSWTALILTQITGDVLQKEVQPILKSEPSSQCVEGCVC